MFIYTMASLESGPGNSIRIATDYWLDGPGSNPSEDEIFRPSRPALGPNGYRVFLGGRDGRGEGLTPTSYSAEGPKKG